MNETSPRPRMHPVLERFDQQMSRWMYRFGHLIDRELIGALFIWFGLLKVFGFESATSIIAKTVYYGPPTVTVPILGAWECLIGVCLMFRPLVRIALLLLIIRLPGTLLALVLKSDVCWSAAPLVPTIQGQYLVKDAIIIGAALVIGGTLRVERRPGVHH